MRVGTIASLGASAALGLGALFVARIWLPAQNPKPVAQASAPAHETPVVLAAAPIAYGVKLQAKDLVLAHMPVEVAPPGAYTSVDQVLKLDQGGAPVTLMAISAREPMLSAKLSGAGAKPTLAAMISDGMRAYTIGVSEVAGGGGHVLPGDRVDVVLTHDLITPGSNPDAPRNSKTVAGVVIQNVRVLGMDLNVDPNSTQAAVAHTATLEVNMQDAEKLALAGQAGTLSLALRRVGAAQIEPAHMIRASDLDMGQPAHPEAKSTRSRHGRGAVAAPSTEAAVVVVHGEKSSSVQVPAERLRVGV